MQFGIQTKLWGPHLRSPERLIRQLAQIGFAGIEFAQHPTALRCAGLGPDALSRLLADLNVTLLGFSAAGETHRDSNRHCGFGLYRYRPGNCSSGRANTHGACGLGMNELSKETELVPYPLHEVMGPLVCIRNDVDFIQHRLHELDRHRLELMVDELRLNA